MKSEPQLELRLTKFKFNHSVLWHPAVMEAKSQKVVGVFFTEKAEDFAKLFVQSPRLLSVVQDLLVAKKLLSQTDTEQGKVSDHESGIPVEKPVPETKDSPTAKAETQTKPVESEKTVG